MKSSSFGKYEYLVCEYDKLPEKDLHKIPMPPLDGYEMSGLCLLTKKIGDKTRSCGHLMFTLNKEPRNYLVRFFTEYSALIAFLFAVITSKDVFVRLHKSQIDADKIGYLRDYWQVVDVDGYYEIRFRDKLESREAESILDEISEGHANYTMVCVVGKKTLEVPATFEMVDSFNHLLVMQQNCGYILMDPKLPTYGELLNYILAYEHSCIELDLATNELQIWVLLVGPFLPHQKFPTQNRKRLKHA